MQKNDTQVYYRTSNKDMQHAKKDTQVYYRTCNKDMQSMKRGGGEHEYWFWY